jgi:uncharacterized membrane protein
VIGPDRTPEQDPRFAFRILVDVANKALSPAINDPTTAVLALDQIDHLLLCRGRRLDEGVVRDPDGRPRVLDGTPDWPDFVTLAVTEIRQYGEWSLQVACRLWAMLEHLTAALPETRCPPPVIGSPGWSCRPPREGQTAEDGATDLRGYQLRTDHAEATCSWTIWRS